MEIQNEAEAEAEAEAEQEVGEEEGITKECAVEETNKNVEESYQDDNSLYATIDERDPEVDTGGITSIDTLYKGPPLPPRIQLTTPRQDELLYASPGTEPWGK